MTQRDALEAKIELIETQKRRMNTKVNIYQALRWRMTILASLYWLIKKCKYNLRHLKGVTAILGLGKRLYCPFISRHEPITCLC